MATSPKIDFTLLELNGANQITIANVALVSLESLGNYIIAIDDTLTAPPGGESDGDTYKIGGAGTGDWAGHSEFAMYYNGAWIFKDTVEDGQMYYAQNDDDLHLRQAGAYVVQTTP